MSQPRFDALRERLLRAGIAPRHVRRYLAELCDHFDDLMREETERGLIRGEEEAEARARLGNDETLAQALLARPELRSLTARFPWAVFGIGPVIILALAAAAAVLIEGGIAYSHPAVPRWSIGSARFSFDTLNWLVMYVAPLTIAAVLCIVGTKQRMPASWILFGLSLICVIGGFHEVFVKWSNSPPRPSEIGVGFALVPPFPRGMIISGLYRAAINLTLAGAVYALWLRRERARVEQ